MAYSDPTYAVLAIKSIASRIRSRIPPEGYPYARQLLTEVTKLENGAAALVKVWESKSPTETVESHYKRVASSAATYSKVIDVARAKLHDTFRTGLKALDNEMSQIVNYQPDPTFALEIRGAIREMSPDAVYTYMAYCAANNKGPELAAITECPEICVGIPDADRVRYRDEIYAINAPSQFNERNDLLDFFTIALDISTEARKVATSLTDPARIADILRGESVASEAEAAFSASLN